MLRLSSVLLFVLFVALATAKFTNVSLLAIDDSSNRVGSFSLFWGNYIVLGADISGAVNTGKTSTIFIYDAKTIAGSLTKTPVKRIDLPYPCTSSPCTTGTKLVTLTGDILTLLNSNPFQFINVNLTSGNVVATAPGVVYDNNDVLKIDDNLVLLSWTDSNQKNWYSLLTISPLSATAYIKSNFYRTWMYSSFSVDPSTRMTYLCAVNQQNLQFKYKQVQFNSTGFTVTNSSVGVFCGGTDKYMTYDRKNQQLLFMEVSDASSNISYVSTVGGVLTPVNKILPVAGAEGSPCGLSHYATSNSNTTIMPMRFLNNQTYGYLEQVQTLANGGSVKDLRQIPPPYLVTGEYSDDGMVNNDLQVFASNFLYCYPWLGSCSSPAIIVAQFDNN